MNESSMVWRCPKCGLEVRGLVDGQMVFRLPGFIRRFCLKCVGRFFAANIPQMERVDEKIDQGDHDA